MSGDDRDSNEAEYVVASVDEVGEGQRIVTELEGREVGVFNVDGDYFVYLNWCAHQGGPLCEGTLTGRVEASYDREALETEVEWVAEEETLICPWHDWEYDIRTGECLSDRACELPSYPVRVEDGDIKVRFE